MLLIILVPKMSVGPKLSPRVVVPNRLTGLLAPRNPLPMAAPPAAAPGGVLGGASNLKLLISGDATSFSGENASFTGEGGGNLPRPNTGRAAAPRIRGLTCRGASRGLDSGVVTGLDESETLNGVALREEDPPAAVDTVDRSLSVLKCLTEFFWCASGWTSDMSRMAAAEEASTAWRRNFMTTDFRTEILILNFKIA